MSRLSLFPLLLLMVALASTTSAQILNRSGEDSTIFISNTVFLPKESLNSGEQNWCIETADLNQDGRQDLIVGSKPDGAIHIHYAEGEGKFSTGPTVNTQPHHRAMCLFDANGDGHPDLAAVTMKGMLCILQNNGHGAFTRSSMHQIGGMLQDVAAMDVDGDGDQDLLIAATGRDEVVWYRNEGNMEFHQATAWRAGNDPRALAVGDLNMDGHNDLVVGSDDGKIYLFLGENKGFRPWVKQSSGAANWAVTIADFNGDGRNDIATASYLDKWLSIHLNQGERGFPISQQVLSGDHNFDIQVTDFDLDGDLDIATCSTLDQAIGFHLNDGSGQFSRRNEMPSGNWNAGLAVADVDDDGDPDLIVSSINDHQIHIHRNLVINPSNEQPREFICLSGYVIDADLDKKLPNTPVSLKRDGRTLSTIMSDDNGRFEFCEIQSGDYVLTGRAPGFDVSEQAFTMPESDYQQDILLHKPASTFLYGLVTDQVSREILPGADVVITDTAGEELFHLLTDNRGRYKTAINPGEYRLEASLEGYQAAEVAANVPVTSNGHGTRVDIALMPIPTDACLAGTVFDEETNEIIPQAVIAIRDAEGNPVRKIRANDEGQYRVCLPFGAYQFSTSASGYFFKVDAVDIIEPDPESQLTKDIYLKPLKEDAYIVLEHIYFDVDKATLRPESVEELERVTEILDKNPSLTVSIEGHTDSDATDAYNLDLSDRRAASVVNYLRDAGVDSARLLYEGFGERRPVAPNDTPENKQLNRRTELRVVSY